MTPAVPAPARRAPRPRLRILHRYLLREVATPTALAFTLYTFVMLMNWFFIIADYAYKYQVPVTSLGELFALQLPHVIVLTIPIGLLVGLLVATARLASDLELTALSASGISLAALLRPIVYLALVFALLTSWLTFDLMPRGNHRSNRVLFEIFRQNLLRNVKPRELNSRLLPGYVFYVREIQQTAQGDVWRGILLDSVESPSGVRGITRDVIFAEEAYPSVDEKAGVMLLTLRDVTVHSARRDSERSYDVRRLREYTRVLPPPPLFRRSEDAASGKSPRTMTLAELVADLPLRQRESDLMGRLYRVEIHKRLAIPFACLVFAFLGLGLGATARRSGKAFGFVVSLGVILVYYQLFYAGERLAVNGDVPAWLSMWAGNLIFGTLGGYLLWSHGQRRETLGFKGLARLGGAVARASAAGARFKSRLLTRGLRLPAVLTASRPRRRLLGIPSLIDRYIIREFGRVFLLVLSFVLLLYVQVTLSQILNDIVRNHIKVATVVDYYLSWLPEILGYVLPISVLITTVVTFSLLTRTNEITAMLVHGISMNRIAAPVLALGLGISLASFGLYDSWAARSAERHDQLEDEIQGLAPQPKLQSARWVEPSDRPGFYHFDAYDPAAGTFFGLSIYELDTGQSAPRRHIFARQADWRGAELQLHRGWVREFHGPSDRSFSSFDERVETFVESRRDFGREWGKTRHLSVAELDDLIRFRERKDLEVTDLRIERGNRRAFPFQALVMLLLGLPFAFAIGRRGSLYGVGIAIVLAIVYWAALVFASYLGKLGVMPPELASWSPNLFFGLVGVAAFLNLRT